MENARQEDVLIAIRHAVELCTVALPDAAVEYALGELQAIEAAVEGHWPLTAGEKDQISLGPFAAKNLADWNPVLSTALMRLAYSLRRDGESIERVFQPV